ncbi:phage holin family protein [Parabacteroides sp. PF5-9]|uniref:phage holin family protein n=1 Tax=Parabacteroides sp. PF5-9 TaxID=1742404 RepID=UPI002476315F|nr:phage holin family protein [Parabacteroides sp. PF5-9]MDH6359136.1 amino acid transporter [Parabacteroides sp. PF5-9]
MEKNLGQIFNELKEDLTTYVELKFEFLKLSTFERAGKVISVLSYVLVILILALLATVFLFVALGIQLGEWLNSYSGGFAIVGGLYLLAIGFLMLGKKGFTTKVTNLVIGALDGADDDTHKDTEYAKETDSTGEVEIE